MAKWTEEDVAMLQSLLDQRVPHWQIAKHLGRTLKAISSKVEKLSVRYQENRKHRLLVARRGAPIVSIRENESDPQPTEEMLADRDRRNAAPFRDLTGVLQGDPRIGYSALDHLPEIPSPSIVPTLAKV